MLKYTKMNKTDSPNTIIYHFILIIYIYKKAKEEK